MLLSIDDPFLAKSSDDVISVLKDNKFYGYQACSIDIKDLYYSLPHSELLACIRGCIDSFGVVNYQNAVGISVEGFMELLQYYLRSTFAEWDDHIYLQRQGVCIGSCLAPILSDLFLASRDRAIQNCLGSTSVKRVFRYVDDFLVLFQAGTSSDGPPLTSILEIFSKCLSPLVITHEVPDRGAIRFLDLMLTLSPSHVCWAYEPRANKPILPFGSAHSKVVKRAIAKTCYTNALRKSCYHTIMSSFNKQTKRLTEAGFPMYVLTAVAECLLREIRTSPENNAQNRTKDKGRGKRNFVVIPYIHGVTHNLKKVASRCDVDLVFSAPEKLARLCRAVNPGSRGGRGCKVKHRKKYVPCIEGVVYSLPLSCGKWYIGQTGRCLNERLKEHAHNVSSTVSGHLGIHCRDCGCVPDFQLCTVIRRHRDQLIREIYEASEIERLGSACVSRPSIALSLKEIDFLRHVSTRAAHGAL
ncbi:uncharacterized protein LOC142817169 [Rhipicephalus microplus]|uniref:uncharacterized protein LOC142817169 n=1 Tax=Rhipicephalus microplus TaxID=6941 RepID=UPI003F6D4DF9